jgi:hypothetical protein
MADPTTSTWQERLSAWWENFLLPEQSFQGPDAKKNLRNARCIMLLFYLAYGGAFVYTIVVLIFSGRVEVMTTSYKVDKVEAPSFAICPFWPGSEVIVPDGKKMSEAVSVTKYGVKGPETLKVEPYICQYDRTCVCANLHDLGSEGVIFQDHLSRDTQNIGATGVKSQSAMSFRERIEVRTNVTDGSGDKTMKMGFYDSVDPAPQFFYMGQGSYVLGTLELQTWTVSDLTFEGLWDTYKGDLTAMAKARHIFRYTSQEVAAERAAQRPDESIFSYEMKNFFVDDTVSAETAFSPYTLLYLLVLIAVRSAVISVFTSTMFPEYDPKKDEIKEREMSGAADSVTYWCRCCFWCNSCLVRDREPTERSRLVP